MVSTCWFSLCLFNAFSFDSFCLCLYSFYLFLLMVVVVVAVVKWRSLANLNFVEGVAETVGSPAQLQFAWWLETVWCWRWESFSLLLVVILFLVVSSDVRWLHRSWLGLVELWHNWGWSSGSWTHDVRWAAIEAWVVVTFIVWTIIVVSGIAKVEVATRLWILWCLVQLFDSVGWCWWGLWQVVTVSLESVLFFFIEIKW